MFRAGTSQTPWASTPHTAPRPLLLPQLTLLLSARFQEEGRPSGGGQAAMTRWAAGAGLRVFTPFQSRTSLLTRSFSMTPLQVDQVHFKPKAKEVAGPRHQPGLARVGAIALKVRKALADA
jgi:hypothetical protein